MDFLLSSRSRLEVQKIQYIFNRMKEKYIIKFTSSRLYLSTKGAMTDKLEESKLYETQESAENAIKTSIRAPTEIIPVLAKSFILLKDKIKSQQKSEFIKRYYESIAKLQKELGVTMPAWEELSPENYLKLEQGVAGLIKEFSYFILLQLQFKDR